MAIDKLTDELHRLAVGSFQAYLWLDEQGATLIDTGPSESGGAIEADLASLGLVRADLRAVILTHFHDDHAGSAAEVAAWGVPVTAHASDAAVIRGEAPGPLPNFTPFEVELHRQVARDVPPAPPSPVDREVNVGDVLDFGGGAVVVHTPGHTDGSMALYVPRYRTLFTGDIAAEHQGDVMLGVFNIDTSTTAQSFARLAALDVDVVCFGHGRPLLADGSARLRAVELPDL